MAVRVGDDGVGGDWGHEQLGLLSGQVVWFLPVNAFDSSCSLATQDRYDNQGACGDAISMLERWFVGLMLAAIVLAVSGVIVATRRPSPARP